MLLRLLVLFMLLVSVLGCAPRSAFSPRPESAARLQRLIDNQNRELRSYAALLRVKMSRHGKIDDFRVEVFSDSSGMMSLYARGFLGRSAFKALVSGDSLLAYFPSERKYFSGLRSDLESGDLSSSRHIVDYLLSLFDGGAASPDSDNWTVGVDAVGKVVKIDLQDRKHDCRLRSRLASSDNRFPFLKLQSIDLLFPSDGTRANIKVQSSHYNRAIPAEKFTIDIPTSAVMLSKKEAVDILTGKSR